MYKNELGWVMSYSMMGEWSISNRKGGMPYYKKRSAARTPPSGVWRGDMMPGSVTVSLAEPMLSYEMDTFLESAKDDGSMRNSITITLQNPEGDSFTGSTGTFDPDKYTTTNVPDGLTVKITKNSGTELSVSLSGTATNHANSNDLSNMGITFKDSAFTINDASKFKNYAKNNLNIDFYANDGFLVNTYTTKNQDSSKITELSGGTFVVVWHSEEQDGDSGGIYGQRYDSNARPVGEEFQINAQSAGDQHSPAVSELQGGGFITVWSSGPSFTDRQIYGQRYDSSGNAEGGEFQISSNTAFKRKGNPSVTCLSDGKFVVVWQSYGQDLDGYGIYGQKYNADGTRDGDEFQVNTHTAEDQDRASVAGLSDGRFVVVWKSYKQDLDGYGIYGQKYNADSIKDGDEFLINTHTAKDQYASSVAGLSDGKFVVVWHSYEQDGSRYGIYGQKYDVDGTKAGGEFQVNTVTAGSQDCPSVTGLPNGLFMVVWRSEPVINCQRYDALGNTVGKECQVGTYKSNGLEYAPAAAVTNNGVAVVWQFKDNWDGGSNNVYGALSRSLAFNSGDIATLGVKENSGLKDIDSLLAAADMFDRDLTWTVGSSPSHGSLAGFPATRSGSGSLTPAGLTYQPTAGYSGSDSFKIQVAAGPEAATITVNVNVTGNIIRKATNTNDSGAGSLRKVLADAGSGDTVDLSGISGGGTITLTTGQLTIDKDITITGNDSDPVIISGNGSSRIFNISTGADVTISNLQIQNGKESSYGGGAILNAGTLTLSKVTIANSSLTGAINGGAIHNKAGGILTVKNCTISGNDADSGAGGGLYNAASATATLNNTTISGNSAAASKGGGINNAGTLNITNTIIANSAGGGDCVNTGTISTNSFNLIEDGNCSPALSDDPKLGALQDNGGSTLTHALLSGSSAIDAGDNATAESEDQRGKSRPGDGDSDGTSTSDIGAFEASPLIVPTLIVTTQAATTISTTGATGNGNVTGLGVPAPSQHGVCWSTSENPDRNDSKTEEGAITATGAFTSSITSLLSGTNYHYRAYATNTAGTSYGADMTFTTSTSTSTPTPTPTPTYYTAKFKLNGKGTRTGGGALSQSIRRGTSADAPTVQGNPGYDFTGWDKSFTNVNSNLTVNAVFAVNQFTLSVKNGTGSGKYKAGTIVGIAASSAPEDKIFDKWTGDISGIKNINLANTSLTMPKSDVSVSATYKNKKGSIPVLTTISASDIANIRANSGGTISDSGDAAITQKGVCWSTSANPTVADSKTSDGSGAQAFTSSIISLAPETQYHVRAYAVNSAGIGYGNEITFTTLAGLTAPMATLSELPENITNATSYEIIVGGIGVEQYKYRLDDNAWSYETPVDQPIKIDLAADGGHILYVTGKSIDNVWSTETDATVFKWIVDTVPPVAKIANSPSGTVGTASIEITVGGADVTAYRYRLDSNEWSAVFPVSIPVTTQSLATGSHTLKVIGTDVAGNWQAKTDAADITWNISSDVPTAKLTGLPKTVTNQTSAKIIVETAQDSPEINEYYYSIDNGTTWTFGKVSEPIELTWLEGEYTLYVNGFGNNLWQDNADGRTIENATTHKWRVDRTPPEPAVLKADKGAIASSGVYLSWKWFSSDDEERIQRYKVWYSREMISDENLENATEVFCGIIPGAPDSEESFSIGKLMPGQKYYFAVKSIDVAGNLSGLSNVAECTTENILPKITNFALVSGGSAGDNSVSREFTITGKNFLESMGCNHVRFENSSSVFDVSCKTGTTTQIHSSIPKGAPTGTYDVRVINKNGKSLLADAPSYAVTKAEVPIPEVTNISPVVVSKGESHEIHIGGNTFAKEISKVLILGPDKTGSTQLYNINRIDSSNLTAVIDLPEDFSEGHYNVQVINSDGTGNNVRHNIINKSPILTHDINLAIQDQWHCKMGAWHTLSSRLSKLILGDFISI